MDLFLEKSSTLEEFDSRKRFKSFPNPTQTSCLELLTQKMYLRSSLTFRGTKNVTYNIKLSRESAELLEQRIEAKTPLLADTLIDDGVYAWLLCDFGDIATQKIYTKKILTLSEIGSKHSDIVKDICNGKTGVPPENVYVYFGGEIIKEGSHLRINFLSGTYSAGNVDSENFGKQFAEDLVTLFREKFEHLAPDLEATKFSFITKESINKTKTIESILFEEFSGIDVVIYKYDDSEKQRIFNKLPPQANARYEQTIKNIHRRYIAPLKNKEEKDKITKKVSFLTDDELEEYNQQGLFNEATINRYKTEREKTNTDLKPLTDEELERYRIDLSDFSPESELKSTAGGKKYKRKSRKSRKSRKYKRKSRKYKRKSRKYK